MNKDLSTNFLKLVQIILYFLRKALSLFFESLVFSFLIGVVFSKLYLFFGEPINSGIFAILIFPFLFYGFFRLECYCEHGLFDGNDTNCQECKLEQEKLVKAEEEKLLKEKLLQEEEAREIERIKLCRDESERRRKARLKNLDYLIALSPRKFEVEIANMFRALGYTAELTPFTRDGGKDVILMKDGKKYLVECKKYSPGNPVGRPELQKFYGAIRMEDAIGGYFVTTSKFSNNAGLFVENEHIKEKHIELIDGEELMLMLEKLCPD